jgi:protein TonB
VIKLNYSSFVAAFVLHLAIIAALLWLNFDKEEKAEISFVQEKVIEISIVTEPSFVSAKKQVKQVVEPKPQKVLVQKKAATEPASKAEVVEAVEAPQKQAAAPASNVGTDEYKAKLRAWLEQYKTYPRRAKMARMQGEATVSFTISPDGHVLSRHLLEGSGYGILDEAAMQALQKASPFPPFPEDLPKQNMKVTVPFSFYLD